MIVSDNIINPVLRDIDMLVIERKISANDADDLSQSVMWLVGKSLNESNIQYVIGSLRGFKNTMESKAVCSIINSLRAACGVYI